MRQLLRRFSSGEEGAGLAEYSVLIALVAICLMGILQVVRGAVGGSVNRTAAEISQRSMQSYGAAGSPGLSPALSNGGVALPGDVGGEEPADSGAADRPAEPSDSQ